MRRRAAERASGRPPGRAGGAAAERRRPPARAAGGAALAAACLALAAAAGPAHAQVLQGRVLDDQDDRPVQYALVQLLDREGRVRGVATADSAGRYRVEAPEPGEYTLLAERIGYDPFRSLLLALRSPDAAYPVDIELRRVPMPIDGITVTAERIDRVRRSIQLAIGLSPASLRKAPILRSEIESHVRRGHGLRDLVRHAEIPGMWVRTTKDGPCFTVPRGRTTRGDTCLPLYLNEFRIPAWVSETLPLDNIEAMVVVFPLESIKYGGGAILLYTAGFIR